MDGIMHVTIGEVDGIMDSITGGDDIMDEIMEKLMDELNPSLQQYKKNKNTKKKFPFNFFRREPK